MVFMIEVALLSGHRVVVSAEAEEGEELLVEQLRHRAQLALGVGIKAGDLLQEVCKLVTSYEPWSKLLVSP